MDPITQTALGVVVGEVTFRRRIGRSANWLAAIAAASPDLDILMRFFNDDPWASLAFHRGATHSLLAVPAIGLLWAGLFWLFRRRQFWAMYALACLAVLTHPLLDLVTSYGTVLFWPISDHRYAFDVLPIIDVFYTPLLLLAIFGAWVGRRFRRSSGLLSWRLATAGLILSTAYAAGGAMANHAATALVRKTVPDVKGKVLEIRCGPMLGNVFARRLVARTEQGYFVSRYNLLTSRGGPDWAWAPNGLGDPVERSRKLPEIQLFEWFTMRMARPQVDHDTAGKGLIRVTWHDMRYGYPADATDSIFSATVIYDASGKLVYGPARNVWRRRGRAPPDVLADFPARRNELVFGKGVWSRMKAMWHESWRP